MKKENIWMTYDEKENDELHNTCELYKSWLDRAKTEREGVDLVTELANEAGYHEHGEYL